jgi:Protein of unknown function (DUF3179)
MQQSTHNSRARRIVWLTLLILTVAALAVVVVPVWIIQPFRAQTDRGLAVSYALRRWSPVVTLATLIFAFVAVGWLWRGSRHWVVKVILIILLVPLLAATWFARQNHFEWMFNPLTHTAYAKAGEAAFVTDSDMVLSVDNNNESVAYPIRLMAYHHVVQDTVGGKPIVATY